MPYSYKVIDEIAMKTQYIDKKCIEKLYVEEYDE